MIDVREILKDAEKCVLLKGRYDVVNTTKTFSEYIDQLRYRKKCIENDLYDIDIAIRIVGEMARAGLHLPTGRRRGLLAYEAVPEVQAPDAAHCKGR